MKALLGTTAFWVVALATAQSVSAQAVAPVTPAAETTQAGSEKDKIPEIIITAEHRKNNLQKAAVSVTARTGEQLRDQGKITVDQILEDVPGVSGGLVTGSAGGGSDTPETGIAIRGVASNGVPNGGNLSTVPSTAVYVDGIYGGLGAAYDIDRVEVLRGPQGTLYGRSATGGVVAVTSVAPKLGSYEADGLVEAGSYNLQHVAGGVNLPLGDQFALRIAGNSYQRDGYESKEGNAVSSRDLKAKLLFKPNEDLSWTVGIAGENNRTRTGGVLINYVSPNSFVESPSPVETGYNHFRQYWSNLDWNLGAATLTYIAAYRTWDQTADVAAAGPGGILLIQKLGTPKDSFTTNELRLASNSQSAFTWLTGVFIYDNRITTNTDLRADSSDALVFSSHARKKTFNAGAYAEGTYHFSDKLRLTGGIRYDYTHVKTLQDYTNNINFGMGIPGSPTFSLPEVDVTASLTGNDGLREFNNTTYKARIEYDATRKNLLYAAISTGFLPGDVMVTTGAGNQPVVLFYRSETLTSYEIGSKNRFLGNNLQINGSLFYYDYGGYQTPVNVGNPLVPAYTLITVPAQMWGFESELLANLSPNDKLSANIAFTDARYVNRPALLTQFVAETQITGSAPVSGEVHYEHDFGFANGSGLAFRGDVLYKSPFDVNSLTPLQLSQGGAPYARVKTELTGNLNLTWQAPDDRFTITAYVRNITDRVYKKSINIQSISPLTVTGNSSGAETDPRTIGVILQGHF